MQSIVASVVVVEAVAVVELLVARSSPEFVFVSIV
jgi:hypothetical protein